MASSFKKRGRSNFRTGNQFLFFDSSVSLLTESPLANIYLPFNFVIVLAKASPFLSMAYSTVSFVPVDDVLKSVS